MKDGYTVGKMNEARTYMRRFSKLIVTVVFQWTEKTEPHNLKMQSKITKKRIKTAFSYF